MEEATHNLRATAHWCAPNDLQMYHEGCLGEGRSLVEPLGDVSSSSVPCQKTDGRS